MKRWLISFLIVMFILLVPNVSAFSFKDFFTLAGAAIGGTVGFLTGGPAGALAGASGGAIIGSALGGIIEGPSSPTTQPQPGTTPVCNSDGTDSSGKCSADCGAASECDGKAPSSYSWAEGDICNWCDGCQVVADNSKPCATAVCTPKGWDGSSCQSSGGSGGTTPPGGGSSGGTTQICSPGSTQCSGTNKLVCSPDGTAWYSQGPSIECCNDGDCASFKCTGAWKPGAPSTDLARAGYCCGDDGTADLGKRFGNYLCVLDNGNYRWIKGEEDTTYLQGSLLFCNNNFIFCMDSHGYSGVTAASECQNDCHYYCELNTKKWIDRRNSPYLSEPLNPDEPVDKVKDNMQGSSGCCPSDWCWNGNQCIENQADEACDNYVYSVDDTTYRCKDGEWKASYKAWSWSNDAYGYCPDSSDCFVGCGNASSNYNPEKYFTSQQPQCIADGQYILDNYCHNRSWITRTSLMATKMVNSMKEDNFEIACGDYKDVLNEYGYLIDDKTAESFLANNCKINGKSVRCTNNFCLIRDLNTNQTIFGTSLNVGIDEGNFPFTEVIGEGCTGVPSPEEKSPEWSYEKCADNIFYNPYLRVVLYSDIPLTLVEDMNGWQAFEYFLVHPVTSIINLIKGNKIYYVNKVNSTRVKFPILNDAPSFGNLFILKEGEISIQGYLERDKFDNASGQKGSYMLLEYNGTPDVCPFIENITSFTNITKCYEKSGVYYVADTSPGLSFLMSRWNDLTTKFLR